MANERIAAIELFRYDMEQLKRALFGKEQWNGLNNFIELIEVNKRLNPNVSLDAAKSLIETICKTILTNRGIEYENDIKFGILLKKTFDNLPVFVALKTNDVEIAKNIINALGLVGTKIGEFRNRHGFFSHGQDVHTAKFDAYFTDLVIASADLLSSFLISAYHQDHSDNRRPFYEDYGSFNSWFDENTEWIEVRGISFSPSKILFDNDFEAYKEAFNEYCENVDQVIEGFTYTCSFSETHHWISRLSQIREFTPVQRAKIIKASLTNEQIYWIHSDVDVLNFLHSVFFENEHCFSPEDIAHFREIYY